MDQALVSLLAASVAFVGTHFALSHPLRAPLVSALREGGFMLAYNAVAIACMVWMYLAFKDAPPADLGGSGDLGWAFATVLTLQALALFLDQAYQRDRRTAQFRGELHDLEQLVVILQLIEAIGHHHGQAVLLAAECRVRAFGGRPGCGRIEKHGWPTLLDSSR
jgi:uncharacterized membrane protein